MKSGHWKKYFNKNERKEIEDIIQSKNQKAGDAKEGDQDEKEGEQQDEAGAEMEVVKHPLHQEVELLKNAIQEFEGRQSQNSEDEYRKWIYFDVLGVRDFGYRQKIKGFHEIFNIK